MENSYGASKEPNNFAVLLNFFVGGLMIAMGLIVMIYGFFGLLGEVGDNEAEVLWSHVCVDGVSVRILCGTADAIRCEQDSSLEYEVVSVSATPQSVKE